MTSKCNINMYADHVAIYCSGKDINEVTTSLNSDLAEVVRWTECNHLKINVSKTQYMVLGSKAMRSGQDVHLRLSDEIVPSVSFVVFLLMMILVGRVTYLPILRFVVYILYSTLVFAIFHNLYVLNYPYLVHTHTHLST